MEQLNKAQRGREALIKLYVAERQQADHGRDKVNVGVSYALEELVLNDRNLDSLLASDLFIVREQAGLAKDVADGSHIWDAEMRSIYQVLLNAVDGQLRSVFEEATVSEQNDFLHAVEHNMKLCSGQILNANLALKDCQTAADKQDLLKQRTQSQATYRNLEDLARDLYRSQNQERVDGITK